MSFDRRLRDGLHGLADEVNPDLDQRLAEISRRRAPSPIRRATTVAAYVLVVAVALAFVPLALRSLNPPGVGGSPSPSPSVQPSPNPVCPRSDGGECAGPLSAGSHRSRLFIPPVTYEVPAGWDNPEDLPGTFTLHPAGADTDAVFVFRDVAVVTQECNWVLDTAVGNRAEDIADWLTSNPNLVVRNRQPWTLGGLTGIQLDLAASGAYTTVCPSDNKTYPAGEAVVPLFTGAGSGNLAWFIGGSEQMRLYLLNLPGGGNVTISVDAIHTTLDSLLKAASPVVKSLYFDPDYY